ncbi:unnamed protein product, partial [Heterosigma akashiwo]
IFPILSQRQALAVLSLMKCIIAHPQYSTRPGSRRGRSWSPGPPPARPRGEGGKEGGRSW